jgi:hypothetical protein
MSRTSTKSLKPKPAFVARAERALNRAAVKVRADYRRQHVKVAVWSNARPGAKKRKPAKTIKATAVKWLASKFGVRSSTIYASKFYIAEQSFVRRPVWWFEIPLRVIEAPDSTVAHLVCETTPEAVEFYYLAVPVEFFREQLSNLAVRENNKVSLFLSAESGDLFSDQRGKGKVSFGRFQRFDRV